MNQRNYKKKYSKYYAAIKYLEGLNNFAGTYQKTNLRAHPNPEMYIERMQDFLDLIGNPEEDFKYIHITGTAGKGSVSSMIHETLVNHGKKSGLFTSPFVVSTIEKIRVGKKYIDPNIFANITEFLKPYIKTMASSGRHGAPSYFEIIFAIALTYFKQQNCEYAVLEVGLGGRYDATNIIKKPLISAITNIGLDHTQILGNTTKKIAYDKSGIIKNGSTFFTTENNPELVSIFKKECKNIGAKFIECKGYTKKLDYEQKNKLLAGSICKHIGLIKNIEDVSTATHLPARFEIVQNKPLIIIDGAHNVSKIKSTVYNLKKYRSEKSKYKKLHLIIAISRDKDWKTMLKAILPNVDTVYATRFSYTGRSCVDPVEILNFSKKYLPAKSLKPYQDSIQAFEKVKRSSSTNDAILVTGSFYLAGEIRALYCPEEQILEQRNSKINAQFVQQKKSNP